MVSFSVRLKPVACEDTWDALGPLTFELMASSETVQTDPRQYRQVWGFRMVWLPKALFCGTKSYNNIMVDVVAHDVSTLSSTDEEVFGYCLLSRQKVETIGRVARLRNQCRR